MLFFFCWFSWSWQILNLCKWNQDPSRTSSIRQPVLVEFFVPQSRSSRKSRMFSQRLLLRLPTDLQVFPGAKCVFFRWAPKCNLRGAVTAQHQWEPPSTSFRVSNTREFLRGQGNTCVWSVKLPTLFRVLKSESAYTFPPLSISYLVMDLTAGSGLPCRSGTCGWSST